MFTLHLNTLTLIGEIRSNSDKALEKTDLLRVLSYKTYNSKAKKNKLFPMISFPRRMAAFAYDTIAIIAVLYFASFVPVIFMEGFVEPESLAFQCFLLFLTAGYFIFCWRRRQTFGMAAWCLFLESEKGVRPSFTQLFIRFLLAGTSLLLFGFGYFWAILDPSRKTLHDKASGTYLTYRN